MGYDIYITKARSYSSNQGFEISPEEWLRIIEADSSLEIDQENGRFFARWSGASKLKEPWLDWEEGNIFTKYPDRALLGKMLEIAKILNAKVQGEEGEIYNSVEDIPDISSELVCESNDMSPTEAQERKNRIIEFILIAATLIAMIVWRNWLK